MHSSTAMPVDPHQEIRIAEADLQAVIEKLFVKGSMFQFDAAVAARRMLEADCYGKPSHGVSQLLRILKAIDQGDIDPRGRVLTQTDAGCFAVLDGSRAVGSIAATKAVELAIEKARAHGLAAVAVGNSQTLGAAEVYCRLTAQADLIGLCLTSTGGATVTAPGTRQGAVGNCAFAYAVPVRNSHPLVFDSACGSESWGKLQLIERYGLPLPSGLLLTACGDPATALENATVMLPSGGTLGFGLSLFCSILAGPLAGGWMPMHKKRRVDAEDSQHFFLALDPAKFCNIDKFQTELSTTLKEIRELPADNETEPVRIPGDRAASCYADAQEHGIPIHQSIAEEIKTLATKKKIPVSW